MRRRTILWAVTLAVAGCSGSGDDTGVDPSGLCGEETRADEYVAGMAKATAMDRFTVRLVDVVVDGVPTDPDRGDNVWTLELLDAGGVAVDGATIVVKPYMPDHGHGTTPLSHDGRPMQDGRYEVGAFDLFMGGFWQFTIDVESGGTSDSVQYGFCVEG